MKDLEQLRSKPQKRDAVLALVAFVKKHWSLVNPTTQMLQRHPISQASLSDRDLAIILPFFGTASEIKKLEEAMNIETTIPVKASKPLKDSKQESRLSREKIRSRKDQVFVDSIVAGIATSTDRFLVMMLAKTAQSRRTHEQFNVNELDTLSIKDPALRRRVEALLGSAHLTEKLVNGLAKTL
ncbi:hypothetical protein [Vibrio chaetopteri]|uniref:Uncharacterized protein n=1 Tax=Vibrio chaetopteri TaxID=3016528 RepID=A0AAU8BS63_9VIBR